MKKFKEILTDMRRTEKVQVRKYTRSKFGNFLFLISAFMFSQNNLCRSVGEVYISAIV